MGDIQIIGLSLFIFTSIILTLVGVITTLERKLVPQGKIKIKINEGEHGKEIEVNPGGTLLRALLGQRPLVSTHGRADGAAGPGESGQARGDSGTGEL